MTSSSHLSLGKCSSNTRSILYCLYFSSASSRKKIRSFQIINTTFSVAYIWPFFSFFQNIYISLRCRFCSAFPTSWFHPFPPIAVGLLVPVSQSHFVKTLLTLLHFLKFHHIYLCKALNTFMSSSHVIFGREYF